MSLTFDPAPVRPGDEPSFPPLLEGKPCREGVDPFLRAGALAAAGAAPGTVVWSPRRDAMAAALVLTPEDTLEKAATILFAVALGVGDSLGALGPPELGVAYRWPAGFEVNGASCGGLRMAAPVREAGAEPDWLVIGVDLPLAPEAGEPGLNPEHTALWLEGCGHIAALRLLESWSRHTLVWINRWVDDGFRPVHEAWWERCADRGAPGVQGLDEHGGMLRDGRLTPLLTLLDP